MSEALDRIRDNPFHVLGLRPTATRAEIEREGQKLLGMVELGLQRAARYATPLGSAPRTADKIRRAMAELRDPDRRLEHELWARLEPSAAPSEAPVPETTGDASTAGARGEPTRVSRAKGDAPWPAARWALGWSSRP
jgi:curved DNA-binding protein CbpA